MTANAPKPPEPNVSDTVNLFGLRLLIGCALLIVAFGVANYLLNWYLGNMNR